MEGQKDGHTAGLINIDNLKEDHREFIKKIILKMQQRFWSEKHVFTEEINKIALSSNNDKRIQLTESIDSLETYVHETSKDLVWPPLVEMLFIVIRVHWN